MDFSAFSPQITGFFIGVFGSLIVLLPGFLKNWSNPKEPQKFDVDKAIITVAVGAAAGLFLTSGLPLDALQPYMEAAGITAPVLALMKTLINVTSKKK